MKASLDVPSLCCGMVVKEMSIEPDPDVTAKELFFLNSPIFIKRKLDEKSITFTYLDENTGEYLTQTLKNKMKLAGLPEDETVSISFDLSFLKKKKKMITYNGISLVCSMCPVIIKGTNQSKIFAWNVGVGNSTGIGFGSIS